MSRRAGGAAEKDFDSGDVSAEMANPLRVAAAPAAAAAESTESDGRGRRQPRRRQTKSLSAKFTRSHQRKKQHTRQARAARWRAGRGHQKDLQLDADGHLKEEHRPGLSAKAVYYITGLFNNARNKYSYITIRAKITRMMIMMEDVEEDVHTQGADMIDSDGHELEGRDVDAKISAKDETYIQRLLTEIALLYCDIDEIIIPEGSKTQAGGREHPADHISRQRHNIWWLPCIPSPHDSDLFFMAKSIPLEDFYTVYKAQRDDFVLRTTVAQLTVGDADGDGKIGEGEVAANQANSDDVTIDGETVVEMLTFDESQFDSNASKFDYLSAEVDELVEVAAKLDALCEFVRMALTENDDRKFKIVVFCLGVVQSILVLFGQMLFPSLYQQIDAHADLFGLDLPSGDLNDGNECLLNADGRWTLDQASMRNIDTVCQQMAGPDRNQSWSWVTLKVSGLPDPLCD